MSVEAQFAENLIKLRLRAGLSQEQLGFAAELLDGLAWTPGQPVRGRFEGR